MCFDRVNAVHVVTDRVPRVAGYPEDAMERCLKDASLVLRVTSPSEIDHTSRNDSTSEGGGR